MQTNREFQTELICDEEYYIKAAEAAMFAYGSPISFEKLAQAIGAEKSQIPQILYAMIPRYKNSAIELLILGDHAQLATKNEYADIVRNTLEIRRNQPLSRAALEVLAIIAYNQPVTRALVDKVRGVESPSVILSLCDKGLIEEKGRLDAPGRPMLYGTTPVFLRTFGLESLEDLNSSPELAEYTKQIDEHKKELENAEKPMLTNDIPGQLSLNVGTNITAGSENSDDSDNGESNEVQTGILEQNGAGNAAELAGNEGENDENG